MIYRETREGPYNTVLLVCGGITAANQHSHGIASRLLGFAISAHPRAFAAARFPEWVGECYSKAEFVVRQGLRVGGVTESLAL
jgi:hypothetical protein